MGMLLLPEPQVPDDCMVAAGTRLTARPTMTWKEAVAAVRLERTFCSATRPAANLASYAKHAEAQLRNAAATLAGHGSCTFRVHQSS